MKETKNNLKEKKLSICVHTTSWTIEYARAFRTDDALRLCPFENRLSLSVYRKKENGGLRR